METLGNATIRRADAIAARAGEQAYAYTTDRSAWGTTVQPEGNDGHSLFVVPPRGENGQYTTLSDVAAAVLAANPALREQYTIASLTAYMKQNGNAAQLDGNGGTPLYDYTGRECDGDVNTFPLIQPGQVLVIPRVENEASLASVRPVEDCVPPTVDLGLIETPPSVVRQMGVILEAQQRVALVRYPSGGALGDGVDDQVRVAEIQGALNMPMLMGHMPEQPDVAARGRQARSTGMQTAYGTGSRVVGEVVKHGAPLLLSFTVGGVVFRPLIMDDTWGPQSADRIMNGRQGSEAMNMQTAGQSYGFDVFGRSDYTNLGGTLLPGLGVDMRPDGRVVDDPNSPHNNNQVYYGAQRNGSDLPNMTFAAKDFDGRDRDGDDRDHDRNGRLSARPSDAVGLRGLSNYGMAQFVFGELNAVAGQVNPATGRVEPHDGEATSLQRKIDAGTATADDYQRYVNLMRFQQELVGISNYDITSPREIESILAADATWQRQLDDAMVVAGGNADAIPAETVQALITARQATDARVALLNPREQLELRAMQAEAAATASGFTVDMNTKGDDLMPQSGVDQPYPNNYPVRSVDQAQMREQMMDYYTVMALTQEDAFQDMVGRETRGIVAAERERLREENPDWSSSRIRRQAEENTGIDGSRWRPRGVNEREGLEGYQIFNQLRGQLRDAHPDYTDLQIREEAMRLAENGGTIAGNPPITVQRMERDLWEDLQPVLNQTARFVDNYTITRNFPENGVDLAHMDRLYRHPEERFSRVERFQDLAQAPAASREDALEGAATVLASSPALTAMLLEASAREPLMAHAWAYFDDGTVQRPAQYGMGGIDRSDEMDRLRDRGYREELMGVTFSREETQGVIRDIDVVTRDLAASATNADAVASRQEDLRLMLTAGTDVEDDRGVLRGQHMADILYALAAEPDNRTLLALEAEIRRANPAQAEAMIEDLRQGVDYVRNERMENRIGISQDDLQRTIARQERGRDALALAAEPTPGANVQTLSGAAAADFVAADIADGNADGRVVTSTDTVKDANRTANLQSMLTQLQTESGAAGMLKLAELAGATAPTDTAQLYDALLSLNADQRAEVFTAGNIAGDAAEIWSRIEAAQVVNTVQEVQGISVRSQGDEDYVRVFNEEQGAERTAGLLQLYMQDNVTDQYAAAAITDNNMLFANKAIVPSVVLQNHNNAAFMSSTIAALRAEGGDVSDMARSMHRELRSSIRSNVRDQVGFTRAEDYVATEGDVAINVKVSAWTYTLSVPNSLRDDPRVAAWMDELGPAGVEAFMRDAVRNANPSSGTARGRMRDVERALEGAIYDAALPSRDALEAELEAGIPALNLANILEAVQNGDPNAAQMLHDFMADPANAGAAQALVNLTASNDPDGLYAAWQNVANAYAADINADPFNLANATPPADAATIAATRDMVLNQLVGSIVTQDPTNAAVQSMQTQAMLAGATTIPNGFYIPFLIIPTGVEQRTPEGRVPGADPLLPPDKLPEIPGAPVTPTVPPIIDPPKIPGM